MAEHRPFPPSTRRRALARAAGLHAASPVLGAAMACSALVLALVMLGRVTSARLGAWIAASCAGSDARALDARALGVHLLGAPEPLAPVLAPSLLPRALLELALPPLSAAALAAILVHFVQTRAVWLPRRRVPGAPAPAPQRGRRASLELAAAGVTALVTLGWLWSMAPRLAALTTPSTPATAALATRTLPAGAAALVASFLAALATAWLALGIIDALRRSAQLAGALRMTPAERREDQRLAGADPRWHARRDQLARGGSTAPPRLEVAGASVLLLGDGVAVAVAWDPLHRPVPVRTATGRDATATQLLGLARRYAVPVHRDPELAASLVDATGPVPEAHWPRLATIIAATRGRAR